MMRLTLISLTLFLAFPAAGAPGGGRDLFLKPFADNSPWNAPIDRNASYEPIKDIEAQHGDINFDGRWSTGVYKATLRDRLARLYIHDYTLWDLLNSGAVKTFGNTPGLEAALRKASADKPRFPANYYSTTTRSPPGPRTFPPDVRDINLNWTNSIYVPLIARPSPDSDAQLAIWQPGGLILECYGAVVCGNGDVICTMASFSDPSGDGTGAGNGRCASLLPNYAGLIRKGEVDGRRISHALSCTVSRLLLAPQFVWPAYAMDMNDRYEGTVPMGSLLAIPPDVNLDNLDLSEKGKIIARAAQEFGIYVVDRGGDGGIVLKASLDADDALYADRAKDAQIIVRNLQRVTSARKSR